MKQYPIAGTQLPVEMYNLFPQRLKPAFFVILDGTAEAVPFPNH
jgi:hypothetical protein